MDRQHPDAAHPILDRSKLATRPHSDTHSSASDRAPRRPRRAAGASPVAESCYRGDRRAGHVTVTAIVPNIRCTPKDGSSGSVGSPDGDRARPLIRGRARGVEGSPVVVCYFSPAASLTAAASAWPARRTVVVAPRAALRVDLALEDARVLAALVLLTAMRVARTACCVDRELRI